VSKLRYLRRVPVARHRRAPGVPAEVKAISGASGLQPLPRVIAVQNGSHSSQLVFNQSVEVIEDDGAHGCRTHCRGLVTPLRDTRQPPVCSRVLAMVPPIPTRVTLAWLPPGRRLPDQ